MEKFGQTNKYQRRRRRSMKNRNRMIAEVINDWMTYMSREETEQRLKEFFLEDFDKWSDEAIEEIWEETQRGSSQH